jgi:hypothetical protein
VEEMGGLAAGIVTGTDFISPRGKSPQGVCDRAVIVARTKEGVVKDSSGGHAPPSGREKGCTEGSACIPGCWLDIYSIEAAGGEDRLVDDAIECYTSSEAQGPTGNELLGVGQVIEDESLKEPLESECDIPMSISDLLLS